MGERDFKHLGYMMEKMSKQVRSTELQSGDSKAFDWCDLCLGSDQRDLNVSKWINHSQIDCGSMGMFGSIRKSMEFK